jgi:hypothetical protein
MAVAKTVKTSDVTLLTLPIGHARQLCLHAPMFTMAIRTVQTAVVQLVRPSLGELMSGDAGLTCRVTPGTCGDYRQIVRIDGVRVMRERTTIVTSLAESPFPLFPGPDSFALDRCSRSANGVTGCTTAGETAVADDQLARREEGAC